MNRKTFINGCMHEFMTDSLRTKSLSNALNPELSIAEAKYICGCVYDDMKSKRKKKNLKKIVKKCSLKYKPRRKSPRKKRKSRKKSNRRRRKSRKKVQSTM